MTKKLAIDENNIYLANKKKLLSAVLNKNITAVGSEIVGSTYSYRKLGTYKSTQQGSSFLLILVISCGQNGKTHQNAYMIVTGIQGWHGEATTQRLAVVGELHAMNTTLTSDSFELFAFGSDYYDSSGTYDIWLKYVSNYKTVQVFPLVDGTWETSTEWSATEPTASDNQYVQTGVLVI